MPKLSPQLWQERRQHVLESAWACFARSGFDATSMDDIIAQTGWSAGAVYRYVTGKDELIELAGAESYAQLQTLTDGLLSLDPPPTAWQVAQAFIDVLDDERHHRAYSLAGLIIQTWAAGLREPAVASRGHDNFARTRRRFVTLARRWHKAGILPDGVAIADIAACLTLIAPAVVVDQTFLAGRGSTALVHLLQAQDNMTRNPSTPTDRCAPSDISN